MGDQLRIAGDAEEGNDAERRGVVWVTFVKGREGTVSVPMPGVPRMGELVDLGGQPAPDHWRVAQVVWVAPTAFSESALSALNLGDLPPVQVHLERAPSGRR